MQQQHQPHHHQQFHPYLPSSHTTHLRHAGNTNQQQQQHQQQRSQALAPAGDSSAKSKDANQQQNKMSKVVPLGASSSYHFASETIKQFYHCRETPNLIARTNHSTVHKVFSKMYNREVAVKIIDKRAIPASLVDKFLPRELEITRIVHHPHLVRCLHVIQPHPTKVAIISEFYSGGTLLQYVLNRKHLDEAGDARIFRQLAEAIQYLHQTLGVVHRDIKMENILLDKNGDVKLADFGFARYISKVQPSTSFCGTRPYSAPQLVEQKPYNPYSADWYASGVVLYTMLSGKWPHEPKTKCVYPLQYPKEFNQETCDLIGKLMSPDEGTRGNYYDVINSEWMKKLTNGKWIFTDDLFVYDIQ